MSSSLRFVSIIKQLGHRICSNIKYGIHYCTTTTTTTMMLRRRRVLECSFVFQNTFAMAPACTIALHLGLAAWLCAKLHDAWFSVEFTRRHEDNSHSIRNLNHLGCASITLSPAHETTVAVRWRFGYMYIWPLHLTADGGELTPKTRRRVYLWCFVGCLHDCCYFMCETAVSRLRGVYSKMK